MSVRRLVTSLIFTAVVAALAASAGTASTRGFVRIDGPQSVSANWSGYTPADANAAGLRLTSVPATATRPGTPTEAVPARSPPPPVRLRGVRA